MEVCYKELAEEIYDPDTGLQDTGRKAWDVTTTHELE
jgi:hypothetical protein